MLTLWKINKKPMEKAYVFLFIYSFFIMLFFTQSSPLFAMNMWVDSNSFFTVGKGMANGVLPYRDLFEQKGPLLYALHALAYTISHTTFFGVYILEVIALFITLVLAFKISRLYLNWMPSIIVSLFLPLLILNQNSFAFGDSAEEFSIPFLLAFIYLMLKNFKFSSDSSFRWTFYLINGILIGCVFWIKYTLVGAWIGFYLVILLVGIRKRSWRNLVNAIIFTFAGLVISSVPWLLYFGVNHAIKDFIDVYIKFNLVTYSAQTSTVGKLINSAIIFGRAFNNNFEAKVMIIIGMIAFIFTRKYLSNNYQKLFMFSTVACLIMGVYFGGREYPYYFLIITPLGLLGLIVLVDFIQHSYKTHHSDIARNRWFPLLIVALSAFFLCFGYNSNIHYSKIYNKEPLPQQTFADLMRKEPNPTLLNYGALDGGFYLKADIVPNVRYFQSQNIDPKLYPENMDEQHRYIKEGAVQFIVVKLAGQTPVEQVDIPHLIDHYRLVSQQDHHMAGTTFRYLLYKKID
ncbi:glycosyltransferase family 39 protein [Bacillus sp. T33-2]|uniref:glycosyltransferase family 39 protein n=1 Tax=Bacillus sp. T33-2 TaxID=2054168 RepID=UPI000C781F66|nr:glycosyltransferase family 39 protein [Bacillus sp. T33-2]PLR90786.1 hypothetical protein CVD19_22405 [Bacillus sp. T33-2]